MPTLGVPELLVILVIVLVFFGAGKLPEVGRALGDGLRAFKKAQREVDGAIREPVEERPTVAEAVEVPPEDPKER